MFFCTAVIVESEGKGIDSQMTKCLFYCQILFPPPKLKEVKKRGEIKKKKQKQKKDKSELEFPTESLEDLEGTFKRMKHSTEQFIEFNCPHGLEVLCTDYTHTHTHL